MAERVAGRNNVTKYSGTEASDLGISPKGAYAGSYGKAEELPAIHPRVDCEKKKCGVTWVTACSAGVRGKILPELEAIPRGVR